MNSTFYTQHIKESDSSYNFIGAEQNLLIKVFEIY